MAKLYFIFMIQKYGMGFIFLLVLLPHGAVYFHSDFEQGQTCTQSRIKPGAKTIRLISNHRLEEWPLTGSKGIVEGNFPSRKEFFYYSGRIGPVLKGVTGITKAHERGVEIRTGDLLEWQFANYQMALKEKVAVKISKADPLFGFYSAVFNCSAGSSEQHLSKNISPFSSDEIHLRFYIRLSEDFLGNDSFALRFLDLKKGDIFIGALYLLKNNFEGIHLGLLPLWDNLSHGINLIQEKVEILPKQIYCIEFSFYLKDTTHGAFGLSVNGIETKQFYQVPSGFARNLNGKNEVFMLFWKPMKKIVKGQFAIDEIILSDREIGPKPREPTMEIQNGLLICSPLFDGKKENSHAATQWELNQSNAWLLPDFNSGEDTKNLTRTGIPYAIHIRDPKDLGYLDVQEKDSVKIPTGIRPGQFYFARVRQKKQNGNMERLEPCCLLSDAKVQGQGCRRGGRDHRKGIFF